MRIRQIAQLCAWSLGVLCLCSTPTYGVITLTPGQQQQQQTQQEILQELVKADVVYLGETHNNPKDHEVQLEIVQALYQKNPKIAIAMEMFQRPYQGIVDDFLAGRITEAQLLEQSEYDERWGFPWDYYAPLLRFAKTHQLPVLALNTPTEVTRKVARSGLDSLTTAERESIPPVSEIRTDNVEYRRMVQEVYELHHQAGQGNSTSFERFFTAQVLWDETMAEAIAQFLTANPDYQVVVLVGHAHIIYGYGIPSRVARRLNTSPLVQRSVLLGVSEQEQTEREKAIADYFWQHP